MLTLPEKKKQESLPEIWFSNFSGSLLLQNDLIFVVTDLPIYAPVFGKNSRILKTATEG